MLSYPSARLALKGDPEVLTGTEWGFTKWQTDARDIYCEISRNWIPSPGQEEICNRGEWKGHFKLGFINNQSSSYQKKNGEAGETILTWNRSLLLPTAWSVSVLCVSPTYSAQSFMAFCSQFSPLQLSAIPCFILATSRALWKCPTDV